MNKASQLELRSSHGKYDVFMPVIPALTEYPEEVM